MKPMSPVHPGQPEVEVTIAKDQPQYIPLPAVIVGDRVVTRWSLTFKERIRILFQGSMWLSILTFGQPLQPLKPQVECPFYLDSGIVDNGIGHIVAKLMSQSVHAKVADKTGWMYAQVWIREEQRHRPMWVVKERYYSGELQSI